MKTKLSQIASTMFDLIRRNPVKSVSTKLLIIIFSFVLLVLAVGFTSYNLSKGIIEDKVSAASEQTIKSSNKTVDLLMRQYEQTTIQLIGDKDFNANLANILLSDDEFDKMQFRTKVKEAIQKVAFSNKNIEALTIVSLTDDALNITTIPKKLAINRESDWYQTILKAGTNAQWFTTQKEGFTADHGRPVIAFGRMLMNTYDGSQNYMLLIELKLDEINEVLADIKISDGASLHMLSSDGTILQSNNVNEIAQKSKTALSGVKEDSGSFKRGNKLVVYSKSSLLGWYLTAEAPVSELVKETNKIWTITLIMALIAILLAIGIGYMLYRIIARPLSKLRNLMNDGAKGDLTIRTDFKSQDEIGQLGESFNKMMGEITQLVQRTNDSAQNVLRTSAQLTDVSQKTAISAKDISLATEEIAKGAVSLSSEAEQGTLLTNDMGSKLTDFVNANSEMNKAAWEVASESESGMVYMSELMSKTSTTEEMTRSMVEKVDKLKESTASIRKILDVLNNITKQTNILSLNATIEATRAGTVGKGFKVVADEIRKLADQSRQSIDIVDQITENIQSEVEETVAVLRDAYPLFQEQIHSVNETAIIFKNVQEKMGNFTSELSTVTNSVDNLEKTQLHLSEAMTSVSAFSEEASASMQQVDSLCSQQLSISQNLVELSGQLESLSNHLIESLTRFRT